MIWFDDPDVQVAAYVLAAFVASLGLGRIGWVWPLRLVWGGLVAGFGWWMLVYARAEGLAGLGPFATAVAGYLPCLIASVVGGWIGLRLWRRAGVGQH